LLSQQSNEPDAVSVQKDTSRLDTNGAIFGGERDKLGYWHGLIQKNEDAISRLEKQIDKLEERTGRGKPREYVDEHAWRIEEKYGKIKDMRELNRRLEERIQALSSKIHQTVESE